MTEFPESHWLFTRGAQSVRLVRDEDAPRWRLSVFGPGTEILIREFANVTECMDRQAEIEQSLMAEGYQVAGAPSDRRSEHGTRQSPDQRRTAS